MSFSLTTAAWVGAAVAAVGVGAQAYSSHESGILQKAAGQQAAQAAQKNAMLADEANNQANAKSPDMSGLMAANLAAGKQGASGTLLTGPGGIDPSQLTLGQSSLLGS